MSEYSNIPGTDLVDRYGNQMYYRVEDSHENEVPNNNLPGGYELVPVNRFFHGTPYSSSSFDIKKPKQMKQMDISKNNKFDSPFKGNPYRKVYNVQGKSLGKFKQGMNWKGEDIGKLPQQKPSKLIGLYSGRNLMEDYDDNTDTDIDIDTINKGGKYKKKTTRTRKTMTKRKMIRRTRTKRKTIRKIK